MHCHDGGKIKNLFLTSGKLGRFFVKPIVDTEVGSHFGNSETYFRSFHAEVFKPKRQLMPHLVSDNLTLGILHDKADFFGLRSEVRFVELRAV